MAKTLDEDFPMPENMKPVLISGVVKDTELVNHYTALASINVNDKVEKKNGLSYLSWAWAVDQLLRADPAASWTYNDPVQFGQTLMVSCTVTAFGKPMTMQLPVMNHRNQAIANPDAFAVNTAMQRCLVKAIALHGLGLYIYAGEDLPLDEGSAEDIEWAEHHAIQVRVMMGKKDVENAAMFLNTLGVGGAYDGEAKELVFGRLDSSIRSGIKAYEAIINAKTVESLNAAWKAAPKHSHEMLLEHATKRKAELTQPEQEAA